MNTNDTFEKKKIPGFFLSTLSYRKYLTYFITL